MNAVHEDEDSTQAENEDDRRYFTAAHISELDFDQHMRRTLDPPFQTQNQEEAVDADENFGYDSLRDVLEFHSADTNLQCGLVPVGQLVKLHQPRLHVGMRSRSRSSSRSRARSSRTRSLSSGQK
jgi:hypothetical protein